jgi:hypothetical protein
MLPGRRQKVRLRLSGQYEGEKRKDESLKGSFEVFVVRQLPNLPMKAEISLMKAGTVVGFRGGLHLLYKSCQQLTTCTVQTRGRSFNREQLKYHPDIENPLNVACFELDDVSALVWDSADEPLELKFFQGLAHSWLRGAEGSGKLLLDKPLPRLEFSRNDRILDALSCSFGSRLNTNLFQFSQFHSLPRPLNDYL